MATAVSRGSSRASSRAQPQALSPSLPPAPSASKPTSFSSSSVSSHLAMVELKQRILAALSKLPDRDTHQIAVDDLEKIIRALPSDGVPMLLSSLLHDPPSVDPSRQAPTAARRECLRLLALLCSTHPEAAAAYLPKIISHVVRRVKDSSDTSVRDACRDTVGSLSSLYLGTNGDPPSENYVSVVSLFVKPLFEAMGEQNKSVQAGAAACLAKVVECARSGEGGQHSSAAVTAFQKLCPRICKFLGGQSFLAKSALLSVVSSLSQVGAITPQSMASLLQSIRECLENSDWVTRKSAADTLCVLASHSSHLIGDNAASILTVLDSCRFDKVKPVRDSMTEALLVWKKVTGDGEDEEQKECRSSPSIDAREKLDIKKSHTNDEKLDKSAKNLSSSSLQAGDSLSISKGTGILEKAVVLLKKKAPSLNDKELNPEFFQKLETRISDDLPVEVVVPRRCPQSSHAQGGEEHGVNDDSSTAIASHDGKLCHDLNDIDGSTDNVHATGRRKMLFNNMLNPDESARDRLKGPWAFKSRDSRPPEMDDKVEISQKDLSGSRSGISQVDGNSESFMNNKGNWLAIQRQLALLERQQASLMNMLQDFMGGSHDSMVTLENRVRGLERVVEEMARDLALSSGRRGGSMLMSFEGSPGRSSSKFNNFPDYSNGKFGWGDGRLPFSERFLSSDGIISGVRGRDPQWRPDAEAWDPYAYAPPKNGMAGSKRVLGGSSADGRLSRSERESDQISNRRAWDKGPGPFRLGEGPSARSVWQASKDEATLEAIRVAGEDNGPSRTAKKMPVPELDAETLGDENSAQDRGQLWASWNHAMDSLHAGDMDSAYAEVLSTGDDLLLVKLMDRSGPVLDQLSNEVACEVVHAVGQFLLEQSLLDIALSWIQQLTELVAAHGPDLLSLKTESKSDILLSLHEASAKEPPEDWEGATAEQMMLHLASTWGINLEQLIK